MSRNKSAVEQSGGRGIADGIPEEIVPLMDLKLALEYRDVALRPEHLQASALSKAEMLELIECWKPFQSLSG